MTSTETWFQNNSAVDRFREALQSSVTWLVYLCGCYCSGKTDLVQYSIDRHNKDIANDIAKEGPPSVEQLRLISRPVVDSASYESAPHDSRKWRYIGQDDLVKWLMEEYVPHDQLVKIGPENRTQTDNEEWLITYLNPKWTAKTEVWLLQGAGFDKKFVNGVMRLCANLKPQNAANRGPLVIFENWKSPVQSDAMLPPEETVLPRQGWRKSFYNNEFDPDANPSPTVPTGSDKGRIGTSISSEKEEVEIRLDGHKDQRVLEQFVEEWLKEEGCEELTSNVKSLGRVLRSFAGGHLGSLRLVLKAIKQTIDSRYEDREVLATSEDDHILSETVDQCIERLNDDGQDRVTTHVSLLTSSYKHGTSISMKLREDDGLVVDTNEGKDWIGLINKYFNQAGQGANPMPIDPVSASIVVASLPGLFEWFRPSVQTITTKVADAFGNVLQDRIYQRFRVEAQSVNSNSPGAEEEYKSLALSIVNQSTPEEVREAVDKLQRAALQLLRDPDFFSRVDLQNYWQDFRRPANTESFTDMWERKGHTQAGAAEELVREATRAGKWSQLLEKVLTSKPK